MLHPFVRYALGVLIKFSGHPQANYPRFEAPTNHITTSVAGGSVFFMKPVQMRPVLPSIFLLRHFTSAFADGPFPDLLLAKSFKSIPV